MRPPLLLLVLLIGLNACQSPPPAQSVWTGSIRLADDRPLAMKMQMDLSSVPPSGFFIVAEERTPIPELYREGDSLVILLAEYQAALRGVWDGEQWMGTFQRYRGDTVLLPFVLKPETDAVRNPDPPPAAGGIRLTGTFRVHYYDPDGIDSSSVATFWTRKDSVFGTFIDPSGDHGLMAGVQNGDSASLGRFIGWQANLIELVYEENTWRGKYYARQFAPEVFTLVPSPGIPRTPLDSRRTRLKNARAPFVFEGITAGGDTVRHTDPRFSGKAVIVDIMGTWCHNCLDEAPLLQRLHEEFNAQGLEIVGLSFEVTDDLRQGRRNLAIYRERHGLTFPLLYAGSLDEKNVEARLRSQLEDFFAYPTTLFIDRTGRVREVHWGFKGPGTGEEYQHEIQLFYKYTMQILAKKR